MKTTVVQEVHTHGAVCRANAAKIRAQTDLCMRMDGNRPYAVHVRRRLGRLWIDDSSLRIRTAERYTYQNPDRYRQRRRRHLLGFPEMKIQGSADAGPFVYPKKHEIIDTSYSLVYIILSIFNKEWELNNRSFGLMLQLVGFILVWVSSGFWLALSVLAIIRFVIWWRNNMFERRFANEDTDAKKDLRLDNFPIEGEDKIREINITEFRKLITEEKPEKIFALAGGNDDVGTWAYFYIRKSSGDLVKTHAVYPMIGDNGLADTRNDTSYASLNIFSNSPYEYKRVEYPGIHPFAEFGRGRSKFVLVEDAD